MRIAVDAEHMLFRARLGTMTAKDAGEPRAMSFQDASMLNRDQAA